MIAIDPTAPIRYIPKCDRDLPQDRQTVFLLKPMSAKDAARIQDDIAENVSKVGSGETVMKFRSGTQILRALEFGLSGWENFRLQDGAEVPWRDNNGKPRPEMFDHIPPPIRKELADVIIEGRDLPESAAKN